MIVPMKQITLLISASAPDKALKRLRKLGVVHIEPVQPPESEDLDALRERMGRYERVLRILESLSAESRSADPDADKVVDLVLDLHTQETELTRRIADLRQTASWFDLFGPVSRESIDLLGETGVAARFYALDKKTFAALSPDLDIFTAREQHGTVYFVHLSRDGSSLDLKPVPMPEREYRDLMREIADAEKEHKRVGKEIAAAAGMRQSVEDRRSDLAKEIEFQEALNGMGDGEGFFFLQGYCPEESTDSIRAAADKQGWAYVLDDPEHPEEVPTLIRKPGWLGMIDPLFAFMGTVPGYAEHDISFWFLLFFSLFFAMLIGDAGYGIVFLGLTIWGTAKFKHAPRGVFALMATLSGATIIWGVITGNWFGYAPIGRLPFFNSLVIDRIDSFAGDNSTFLMYLCFVIGVVHLSIAHGLKAFRAVRSPRALSEIGWIGILWSLFFVAGNLVIGKPLPPFMMPLLLASIGLTLVFSNFQKNILKGIGATLGDLPLSIISSFSDVVSYLRLFAVGYASVTVAASFNDMAVGGGVPSVTAGVAAALVLFLGHGLNIVLGLMAVVVHGVRLNMLEFSGQLDMQWAGKPYKPFTE
ncbi:hypothetical protein JXO52_03915 [bacterium]|nr:hypothetical protein [bacterium]